MKLDFCKSPYDTMNDRFNGIYFLLVVVLIHFKITIVFPYTFPNHLSL